MKDDVATGIHNANFTAQLSLDVDPVMKCLRLPRLKGLCDSYVLENKCDSSVINITLAGFSFAFYNRR